MVKFYHRAVYALCFTLLAATPTWATGESEDNNGSVDEEFSNFLHDNPFPDQPAPGFNDFGSNLVGPWPGEGIQGMLGAPGGFAVGFTLPNASQFTTPMPSPVVAREAGYHLLVPADILSAALLLGSDPSLNYRNMVFDPSTGFIRINPAISATQQDYQGLVFRDPAAILDYSIPYDIDSKGFLALPSIGHPTLNVGSALRSKYGQFSLVNEFSQAYQFGPPFRPTYLSLAYFGYVAPFNFARPASNLSFYTSDINHIPGLSLGLVSPLSGAIWMNEFPGNIAQRLGSISDAVLDSQNNRFFGMARGILYRGNDEGVLGARPFTRGDFGLNLLGQDLDIHATEAFNSSIPGFYYLGDYQSWDAGGGQLGAKIENVKFFANQGFYKTSSAGGLLFNVSQLTGAMETTTDTGSGHIFGAIGEGFGINLARGSGIDSIAAAGFLLPEKVALTSVSGTYTGAAVGTRYVGPPVYGPFAHEYASGTVSLTPDFAARKLTHLDNVSSAGFGTMYLDATQSVAVDREHIFGFNADLGADNRRFLGSMALPSFYVNGTAVKPSNVMWGTWNYQDGVALYGGMQNFWVAGLDGAVTLPSTVLFYDAANVGVDDYTNTTTGISAFAMDASSGPGKVAGIIYHNDGRFAIVKGASVSNAGAEGDVTPLNIGSSDSGATSTPNSFHGKFSSGNASSFFYDWRADAPTRQFGVGVGVQTSAAISMPASALYTGTMAGFENLVTPRSGSVAFTSYTGADFKMSADVTLNGPTSLDAVSNTLNTYISKNSFYTALKPVAGADAGTSYVLGLPGLEQYAHLAWGVIRSQDTFAFFGAGQQSALTSASQLAALEGSANRTYLGEAMALLHDGGLGYTSGILSGRVTLNVDMTTGGLSGGFSFQNNETSFTLGIATGATWAGLIDPLTKSPSFSGDLSIDGAGSGTFQGQFFGAQAQEVGGTFSAVAGSRTVMGAFGAKN